MTKWNPPQTFVPPAPSNPSPSIDRKYMHRKEAGATLPAWQATFASLGVMALTSVFLWLLSTVLWWTTFDFLVCVQITLFIGAASWLGMFLFSERHWLNITAIQKAWQEITDQDEPEPPAPEVVVRFDRINKDKAFQSSRYTFPVTDEQLSMFAHGFIDEGKPISRRTWTPKKTHGFSDDEWRKFQAQLIKYGFAENRAGEGLVSTEEGHDFFAGYAQQHEAPSPILQGDVVEK